MLVGFCQNINAEAAFAPKQEIIKREVVFLKHPKLYAKKLLSHQQYLCLVKLWTQESHWNPKALNKSSGAYGIAQFLPTTWGNYNFKKTSNAVKQVEYGLHYIKVRYSTSCNAWRHEQRFGWY